MGQILNQPGEMQRFWPLVDCSGGPASCWPWQGRLDPDGYGLFTDRSLRAHRIVYELSYNRVLMPWAVVRHDCDNRRCCNPLHLTPGTQQMNVNDRVERGRSAFGQANGRNVLTEQQVLEIFASKEAGPALAARYGVSRFTVADIRRGRIWGWLTGPKFPRGNGND